MLIMKVFSSIHIKDSQFSLVVDDETVIDIKGLVSLSGSVKLMSNFFLGVC